jgi:hypothetical protein
MGFEEGPIDKYLRPPMYLWAAIKTNKTEIKDFINYGNWIKFSNTREKSATQKNVSSLEK